MLCLGVTFQDGTRGFCFGPDLNDNFINEKQEFAFCCIRGSIPLSCPSVVLFGDLTSGFPVFVAY